MKRILCVSIVLLSFLANAENILKNANLSKFNWRTGLPTAWRLRQPFTGERIESPDNKNGFCLKLNATGEKGKYTFWVQDNLPLVAGQNYTVTYSAKAAKGKAYTVYIEWKKDKGGKKRHGGNAISKQLGTGEWQTVTFNFKFPQKALSPYFVLRGLSTANYLFRNLSVKLNANK